MLSISLFFNGFFKETKIVIYSIVTDVIAVEETVVVAVVVVAVITVVTMNIVKATTL